MILKSFATMASWRRRSLPPSATTERDRSARRPRSTQGTRGDSHDCRTGAGEAHRGVKAERGADCAASGAAGGAGVAAQSVYPDNSHEVLTIEIERFVAARLCIRIGNDCSTIGTRFFEKPTSAKAVFDFLYGQINKPLTSIGGMQFAHDV